MQNNDDADEVLARLRDSEAIWELDGEKLIDLMLDTARAVAPILSIPELKAEAETAYTRFELAVPLTDRLEVLQARASSIENSGTPVEELKFFMLMDLDGPVAATASTEFVRMAPLVDEDPQSRVREVVETILPHAHNPGAVLGGMISVGDRRLAPLLLHAEEALSWKEIEAAAFCNSGFPIVGRLEFWLAALEKYIEQQQQTSSDSVAHWNWDMRVGRAMTGLERIVTTALTDDIVDAETEFGYPFFEPPREPLRRLETVPLQEIGHRYADRFWAVESRETAPRAMPYIMGLYGIEPRSPRDEWWEPPTPATAEDAGEEEEDDDDDDATVGADSDEAMPPQRLTWLDRLFFLLGRRWR